MYVVIADHKIVLVTDVDDVAWDTAQEMMCSDDYVEAKCEHAYTEELYEQDFDENGNYTTTEGDVVTLADYQNTEHVLR